MIDLRTRAREPEALDVGVAPDEALRSLADLRFVNRWLGNRGRFVGAVLPYLRTSARPRLLDVGCGSGDVAASLLHLQAAPPDLLRVVADARRLPFAAGTFDVVTASLFLHHFDAAALPELLRGLYALARRALVVNDLRRARVPYVFGKAVFPLLFKSRVSVEDGLISIRSSFRETDLRDAFAAAGVPSVRIERSWPYRLLAVAEKSPA